MPRHTLKQGITVCTEGINECRVAGILNGDVVTGLVLKSMYGACTEKDCLSVYKPSNVWEGQMQSDCTVWIVKVHSVINGSY